MQFAAASQQQHHHSNSNNDGSLGKHVSSHRRPFTVFVGNLSFFCKEEHLVDLFKKYGPVLKVTVARNVDMANNSLLYGYVEFERAEDASKAMDGTHGNLFMGRRLRVFTLSSPPQTNTINKPSEYFSVHVNFVTHDAKKVVHEEFLHDLFSQHGSIVDIAIRRYFRQQRRQYGYAFVDFYDREAAIRAAEQYAHQNIDGIRLQSTLGYRSMDHSSGPSAESKATDSHADRRQSSHDVASKTSHGRSPVSVEQVHRHPSPTNGPVVQLQSAPVFPKVPIAQAMPSPSSPTNSYMPMPQMPMFSSGSQPPMPHFPMQYMLPPQSHNYPMYMPQMAYFIPQNTNNNNHHASNKNANNTNESGSPMIVPPQPQMYYYIPHPSYNPAMVMSQEGHAASQEALSASN